MSPPAKIQVRIVIEGAGQNGPFRSGFREFFIKFLPTEIIDLSIMRGKNGEEAAKKFEQQRNLYPDALIVLLIDSEFPVPERIGIWNFLEQRGGFAKPDWASDDHVYLMVQCVETWINSDREALQKHHGQKLKASQLPKRANLEEEPKADVQRKLKQALGAYEHSDAPKFIQHVTPDALRKLSLTLTDKLDPL